MNAVDKLPDNYVEIFSVDLQNNKKIALLVNVLAMVIAGIMVAAMSFYVPVSGMFNTDVDIGYLLLKASAFIVLIILYLCLHELVHGAAMKMCGTKKIKYGFTGMYAFAGSDDYYYKKPYIFIALAPVVLWGIVLAVINCFVPSDWFWIIYFIQIINISGAAGDFYVTVRFIYMPDDILIRDYGTSMFVYSQNHK